MSCCRLFLPRGRTLPEFSAQLSSLAGCPWAARGVTQGFLELPGIFHAAAQPLRRFIFGKSPSKTAQCCLGAAFSDIPTPTPKHPCWLRRGPGRAQLRTQQLPALVELDNGWRQRSERSLPTKPLPWFWDSLSPELPGCLRQHFGSGEDQAARCQICAGHRCQNHTITEC